MDLLGLALVAKFYVKDSWFASRRHWSRKRHIVDHRNNLLFILPKCFCFYQNNYFCHFQIWLQLHHILTKNITLHTTINYYQGAVHGH